MPGPTAFVPTMGALHEGHLELVRRARRGAKTVVVSIFVNPTQFGPNEDYARYPRDLEKDALLVEAAGADAVYAPTVETMYPRGAMTKLAVPEVTERYEGAARPGHFDGVATVVLKLLNQIRPNRALFGRKDLQQCAVIRRMIEDLNVPTELEFVPTFRESDGLAMSSRNRYLTARERVVAPLLHRTLVDVAAAVQHGGDLNRILLSARGALDAEGFECEYLDLVSSRRFVPLQRIEKDAAIVVAARLGATRLIDNIELDVGESG